ncbi:MAG: SRPBCC family protein [Gemmatimonadetes bacterium]|nr:SRPBCC family protein [Gemmatimonadota bacterium]
MEKAPRRCCPRARVWRALSDATEFGTWFGITLDGPFVPGTTVHGNLRMAGLEHVTLEMRIERVEPEGYFSYQWHPGAIDPKVDYTTEPMTLVEFLLKETATGTAITIIESGFDQLPATRRVEAFRMNTGGWNGQSKKLAGYVE